MDEKNTVPYTYNNVKQIWTYSGIIFISLYFLFILNLYLEIFKYSHSKVIFVALISALLILLMDSSTVLGKTKKAEVFIFWINIFGVLTFVNYLTAFSIKHIIKMLFESEVDFLNKQIDLLLNSTNDTLFIVSVFFIFFKIASDSFLRNFDGN